ncbi:MAG: ribosome biogenesis GTPase Der [Rhodocyclaceae bacterium]|nr:ribosome biogenesis GTPase Der [Rhodocyclaceae bacterium]
MLPTLVLVGRPNVGKSTLFNRLTRSRAALVADRPGLTRDRHYGRGKLGGRPYWVVDTGGLMPEAKEGIEQEMTRQAETAMAEADALLFLVDARSGLTAQDKAIAEKLRRLGRPVFLVVNKAEGMEAAVVGAEFHELGLGAPHVISAAHGDGVRTLIDDVLAAMPDEAEEWSAEDEGEGAPRVAIVGRPNVGKSTLVNALLGEERMISFDQPGTTRDAIEAPFMREGRQYVLIDTAGLRRKGRVADVIEKFSVIKTLQAIESADVVIVLLDATQEVAEQDAHIAGICLEAGRAMVIAVNKWDAADQYRRSWVKQELARKLAFLSFVKTHFISAKAGTGLDGLMKSVDEAHRAANAKLPTPKLTRVLRDAVARQSPPRHGLIRPKLRYAHQGGSNPPVIVIHGNALEHIPPAYVRYLEHSFRTAFGLVGTPLSIQFKTGRNPFAEKA